MKKITLTVLLVFTAMLAQAQIDVFINELHYDNSGGDTGEFFEIAGPAGTDLTGWTVELYNGNGGAVYNTINLTGTIDDEGGTGFGALSFLQAGIQNGAPDGLALVDNGALVQFLSYEGTFTATNGAANGVLSENIGTEPGSTPIGESLNLTGTGAEYADFVWGGPSAASPGDINPGQTFSGGGAGSPPMITCPPSVTAPAGAGVCEATVGYSQPIVSDPDGDLDTVVLTAGLPSGSLFPVGDTTVTYTATDLEGNFASCSFVVTVIDDQAPTAVCQNITVELDANGEYVLDGSEIDGGSTDNCGNVTFSFDSPVPLASNSQLLTLGNGNDGESIGYNPVDGFMYHASGISVGDQFFEPIDLDNLTVGANLAPGNTWPAGLSQEVTGMVYYAPLNGFIALDRSENIALIDPVTGDFSLLATLARDYIRGFAVVGTSVYGVDPFSSDLVAFDPNTGAVNSTVPVVIDGVEITNGSTGITANPITGDVFVIYKGGGPTRSLAQIDVTTGIGTSIGNTGMRFSGISFDAAGTMYGISGDGATPSETLFAFDSASMPTLDFTCADVGVNAIELTVTDDSGNTSTCTAEVTVEDNIAPEIVCLGGVNGEPVFINELHYDNTGGDQDEAIEIAGPAGTDLSTYSIILYNGNGGTEYNNVALSGTIDDEGAGYGAVNFPIAGIQNGAPDGIVLAEGGTVIQFLSYEGAFTATDGIANGLMSTDIGVLEVGSTPIGESLQLGGTGANSGDFSWNPSMTSTPGDINTGQTFVAPTGGGFDVNLDANGMATINVADLLSSVNEACGWTATVGDAPVTATLPTLFDGGNGQSGNMFDINALENVTIDSFDVHLVAGTTDDIEVYFKAGTFVGSEADPSAWTLLATAAGITSAGDNTPTPLGLSLGQTIAAGDTGAFYVTTTLGGTMAYTNGTTQGAIFSSDANIEFLEGDGVVYPFAGNFSPRVFNGNILYTVGDGPMTTLDVDCSMLGANSIEITVTDDSGNVSMCSTTVNVFDVTDPILICMDVTIELGPDGTAEVDPAALLAVAPSTFDAMVIGSDNQSGTAGTTDFTVDVTAAETVSFDWMYTSNDDPGFDSFGYVLNGTYTQLTDNAIGNQMGSASVAVAPGDVFGFRSVTDDNGFGNNETLITNFLPGFDGQFEPANWTVTLDNSDGDAFFIEIPGGPLSFDACGITVLAVDVTDVSCADIGTPITAMVFASDASGNIAACNSIITVVDALAPEVTCPADQTIDPGPGNLFYEVPDYFATGEATAIDNCTDPLTILSQSPAAGDLIPDGVYTVTITAEDEYGNVGECTFELTIESVLGLDDNVLDSSITMFPNPANASVTLSNTSNIALEKAAIYDTNGRLINTIDLSTMQQEKVIDVSALATGVYMVQIQSENASTVKRLVKE